MAERTVQFKFLATAQTQELGQFAKEIGALDKRLKSAAGSAEEWNKSLRGTGAAIQSDSATLQQSKANLTAIAGSLRNLASAATVGSKAYYELTDAANKFNIAAQPGTIGKLNLELQQNKQRLTELDLAAKGGSAEYARLQRSIAATEAELKRISGSYTTVATAAQNATRATNQFNAAQSSLARNPITGRVLPPVNTGIQAQFSDLPPGYFEARRRALGLDVAAESAASRIGASTQLPRGYFDERRRALGLVPPEPQRPPTSRTGNRFMAAGAISAGAFFGGPEGALGGIIGAAIGGPGAALGGASIGAQAGIVRKQIGEFASLEAQLTKYNIALENVAGSQAEFAIAQAAIASANERLNIPLLQGTQSFTQLAAAVVGAGGNIRDAELAFNAVNSAIKATGGDARDVEGALLAITQVFSKGKVSAEELRRQLGDRLPGAFQLFADSIGKTGPELDEALKKGEVGLNDLMTFLVDLQRRYQGTAEEIAASSEDAGARLATAWEQARLSIGEAIQPIGAEFQESLIAFLSGNEEEIKAFAASIAGAAEVTLQLGKTFGPAAVELGKLALALKASQVALGLASAAWVNLTTVTTAGGVAITGVTGAAGLATAGITKLRLATTALARAWAAPIVLTLGIIGVSKILGDIAKIKEARNELENLQSPSQTTSEYIRRTFRNSVVTEENRDTAISELERLTDEAQELRKRVNDLRAQANSRNQRRTSQSSARAQLATAEEQLRQNQQRTAAVGQLLSRVGTGSGSSTGPSNFPAPEGAAGSDSAADKAARDAERLAAEQRRLAEARAQQERALAKQLFDYQLQLDQQRYDNLRRLMGLQRSNEVAALDETQREVAGLGVQLESNLLDVVGRLRDANIQVRQARQQLEAAQKYQGSIGEFTVPARGGGGATGGGLATFGRTGRMSLAAGYGMVDVRGGNRSSVVQDAADIVLANAARGVSTFVGGDMSGDVDVTRMAGARLLQALERGVDRHANRVARGTYAIDLIAPVGTPVGIPLSGVSNRGGATGVAGTTPRGNIALHLGAGSRSGGSPAGSPAVRSEIGNLRSETDVATAQAGLNQALELEKQLRQDISKEIDQYIRAFELAVEMPIRDQIAGAGRELDALKLRNRLLLEGADPATIEFEERMLTLRVRQEGALAGLNDRLAKANELLAAAQASGDQSGIEVYQAQVKEFEERIAKLPGLYSQLATATRDLFNESQRMEQPWERLQLAINGVKKELDDLQDSVNQIQTLASGIGDAFGNSFGSIITGSSSVKEAMANLFRDVANLFADMVSRIIAKAIEAQILQGAQGGGGGGLLGWLGGALFSGLGGGFGGAAASPYTLGLGFLGGASPLPLSFSARGNVFGPVTPFAQGGVVNNITPFRFASGGVMRNGVMGESGPEAIMPLRRTASGDLGVVAAGAGRGGVVNQVTVNVDAKGSNVSGDNNDSRKLGAAISDAVQAELVRQQRPGGLLDRSRTKSR